MHVVATAGHVDHGKTTLVDALTGMRSDRLEEERRRGLSIELGYVWTALPGVGDVAFVDVPGHERFVTTMLAGVGPVPAVLLVVAADDPWMPQAAEHLAALDALGVTRGVVAVTRCDLADPAAAVARASAEVARTSLRGAPVVPVSARTGAGLDDLRRELATMVRGLPRPDPGADVRLWVDRRFTVRGAGTVVTGTLPAGTVRRGDVLAGLTPGSGTDRPSPVRVRGVQALGQDVDAATGVARVALNLAGDDLRAIDRGSVLLTPEAWHLSGVADVRLAGDLGRLPEQLVLHVGAAATTARVRPLPGDLARLTFVSPLPLRIGDRALLRDPGSRRMWGVRVLDPDPPVLGRRGAALERGRTLASHPGAPDLAEELDRRGVVAEALLRRLGVPASPLPPDTVRADGWLVSASCARELAVRIAGLVGRHAEANPLDPGLPLGVLADELDLSTTALVAALVRSPLEVRGGRAFVASAQRLPDEVEEALQALTHDLDGSPFAAPDAHRLAELGLDQRRLAAAARAGRLLRVAPGVVLLPGADGLAADWLAELPQPFTTSEARQRLGTSRRVVLPLLEHLDRSGLTHRLPDDRRRVLGPQS